MRILFLTEWFDPEPGALRGLPLASWLVERGHEVRVITAFPNYPGGVIYPGYRQRLCSREWINGVDIYRLPVFPSHDGSPARRMLTYGTFMMSASLLGTPLARGYDVAYVYHPPGTLGLPAVLWRSLWHMPFVYHVADLWPDSVVESPMLQEHRINRLIRFTLTKFGAAVERRAHSVSVLSPKMRDIMVERGADPHRIELIYNWADESVFFPQDRDEGLAAELGLTGRFNVLYAGNLGPFQGLDMAIRAAARMLEVPEFQLVIAGRGQSEPHLRRLAGELGAHNVKFLGTFAHRDMGKINALADALLVTLRDVPGVAAAVPSKTQVAMACGRPIAAAGGGALKAMIVESGAGRVVPPDDPEALHALFQELCTMPRERLDELGRKGRAFYEETMALNVGGKRTERLLAEAATAR